MQYVVGPEGPDKSRYGSRGSLRVFPFVLVVMQEGPCLARTVVQGRRREPVGGYDGASWSGEGVGTEEHKEPQAKEEQRQQHQTT